MNYIIIGMPASGKSSVAVKLSAALGYAVADTDRLIEERYGKITSLFAERGEDGFRAAESAVINSLARVENCVIATGGGSVLTAGNAENFKALGKIIYLKTGTAELCKRLKGDITRPLIGNNKRADVTKLQTAREPVYSRLADITVETDGRTVDETVKIILEKIK